MIYEGALIQRLVTPQWPGDPILSAAGAPEFRMEYVLREPAGAGDWTLKREEGFHYPTHLAAAHRAREISPHCHASVVGGDREQVGVTFSKRDGAVVARLAHNLGSNSTPATNLPAEEGSSSRRAPKQLPGVPRKVVETKSVVPRAAGKTFSKDGKRSRLSALRASAGRISDRTWYRQGQYA